MKRIAKVTGSHLNGWIGIPFQPQNGDVLVDFGGSCGVTFKLEDIEIREYSGQINDTGCACWTEMFDNAEPV
jgi:hypothetical protein